MKKRRKNRKNRGRNGENRHRRHHHRHQQLHPATSTITSSTVSHRRSAFFPLLLHLFLLLLLLLLRLLLHFHVAYEQWRSPLFNGLAAPTQPKMVGLGPTQFKKKSFLKNCNCFSCFFY